MTDQDQGIQPEPRRKAGRWWKVLIAIVGVLTIGGGVIGAIAISTNAAAVEVEALASASASAENSRSAEAANNAALEKAKAKRDLDRSTKELAAAMERAIANAAKEDRVAAEAAGWTYVSDYLYYAKLEGYQCSSRYRCVGMIVTNIKQPDGCPRGMGVSVSFLSPNDVSVYNSSRSTGTLHLGDQAELEFSDLSGQGSAFRVDSIRCY